MFVSGECFLSFIMSISFHHYGSSVFTFSCALRLFVFVVVIFFEIHFVCLFGLLFFVVVFCAHVYLS